MFFFPSGIWILGVQYLQDAELYESKQEAVCMEEVLGSLDQVDFIYLLLIHFTSYHLGY